MSDYIIMARVTRMSEQVVKLTNKVDALHDKLDTLVSMVDTLLFEKTSAQNKSSNTVQYQYAGNKPGVSNSPVFHDNNDSWVSLSLNHQTGGMGPR